MRATRSGVPITRLLLASSLLAVMFAVLLVSRSQRTGRLQEGYESPVAETSTVRRLSAAPSIRKWPLNSFQNWSAKALIRKIDGIWGVRISWVEVVPSDFADLGIAFDSQTVAGEFYDAVDVTAAFDVEYVAPVHANKLYVGGKLSGPLAASQAAWTVIEAWTVLPPMGAPTASREVIGVPIGVPAPHSRLSVGIKGGVYKSPQTRARPTVQRSFVLRTQIAVQALSADPDGRYLLLSSSEGVYRHSLLPEGQETDLIVSVGDYPELASTESFWRGRHVDGSKKFILKCSAGDGGYLVLSDVQNDGQFESVALYSADEYESAGFRQLSSWEEDYVSYRILGM